MPNLDKIRKKIDDCRADLEGVVVAYGDLQAEEVLAASKKMDEFISEYYKSLVKSKLTVEQV